MFKIALIFALVAVASASSLKGGFQQEALQLESGKGFQAPIMSQAPAQSIQYQAPAQLETKGSFQAPAQLETKGGYQAPVSFQRVESAKGYQAPIMSHQAPLESVKSLQAPVQRLESAKGYEAPLIIQRPQQQWAPTYQRVESVKGYQAPLMTVQHQAPLQTVSYQAPAQLETKGGYQAPVSFQRAESAKGYHPVSIQRTESAKGYQSPVSYQTESIK